MKSTDHNINNPTIIDDIPLMRYVEGWELPKIMNVTKEFYDLIQIKDPMTIYNITDDPEHNSYFGNMLLNKNVTRNKYFMTYESRGEYCIYFNDKNGTHGNDCLIEICRFAEPDVAIRALTTFNAIGDHHSYSFSIYILLSNYIRKEISIHDMLIGIICSYGYKNSTQFQQLLSILNPYIINEHGIFRDLPVLLREELHNFKNIKDITDEKFILVNLYSNLYDIIIKYNFFKDKKYYSEMIKYYSEMVNLQKEIWDIHMTVLNFKYVNN